MLFNSFEFLWFLPTVFLLYWFVMKGRRAQNLLIVVASYIFYGWWDWRFLLLIALTSFCSYISGLLISRPNTRPWQQTSVLTANLLLNLGILGVFKYYNFFALNLSQLLSLWGYQLDSVTIDFILPVGISFYTFQALSYTIDVYRRQITPTHDVVEFFAYIAFFPQLVAGPIERATHLLPQFRQKRHFDYATAIDGMRQMLWGFAKKLIVADNAAAIVNKYWAEYDQLPGVSLILLAVLFSLQIYCDFSGYSDIAIGCARLFGISLRQNFSIPYFSRNIPEFWRRWHISLMTWLRDYIYFPLGGSRDGLGKTIRNIYIVWAVSGLWHGANWTFVCWGLYHATLIILYRLMPTSKRDEHPAAWGRMLPTWSELGQIVFTFALAALGWIIFRSQDMHQAAGFIAGIFCHPFYANGAWLGGHCLAYAAIMMAAEWLTRDKAHPLEALETSLPGPRALRWGIYYALILAIWQLGGDSQSFIYFQF